MRRATQRTGRACPARYKNCPDAFYENSVAPATTENGKETLMNRDFTATADPIRLFAEWLAEAEATEPNDPNAMALATVDGDGLPDVRMVLLKGHDARGFVFYTNFDSTKGRQLIAHPRAALVVHWKSLRRQVRVRGSVTEVTPAEADAYFASRSRGSQVGAWASIQSRPLESRAALEKAAAEYSAKFPGAVPRPPHWSGFRLAPVEIEFWQDGAARLHDRVVFRRIGDKWEKTRLNP
ncbi:MAG TPA: pyridoxamine 5'-phosphate oxidase [Bauldia sp.]